jgi:hypothetical protein
VPDNELLALCRARRDRRLIALIRKVLLEEKPVSGEAKALEPPSANSKAENPPDHG